MPPDVVACDRPDSSSPARGRASDLCRSATSTAASTCSRRWHRTSGATLENPVRSGRIEIFLGDYVDRGPQSREVIEWLTDNAAADRRADLPARQPRGYAAPRARRCIGDVELAFQRRRRDADILRREIGAGLAASGCLLELQRSFREALPPAHLVFISALPRIVDFDPYLFVHAGIRPGAPIEDQDPEDLVWIRRAVSRFQPDFGCIVVHGHTPTMPPGSAARTASTSIPARSSQGCLTCLVLEGRTRRFLQTFLT